MTVAECQQRISSVEFTRWIAFFEIERQEQEKAQKKPPAG